MSFEEVHDRYVRLLSKDQTGKYDLAPGVKLRLKVETRQVGIFWQGQTVGWFDPLELADAIEAVCAPLGERCG